MDKAEIQNYKSKPERLKKLRALDAWCTLKSKKFRWCDALDVIYSAANGDFDVIDDIIAHLTDKKKRYGKGGYMVDVLPADNAMDIRVGNSGNLELFGYNPSAPLTAKGQKVGHAGDNSYRKDGQRSKVYLAQKERLWDIGSYVRKLYPDADVIFIRKADQGIMDYCRRKHLSPEVVYNLLLRGRLTIDDEGRVVREGSLASPKTECMTRLKRVIVVSESMVRKLQESTTPTEYQFTVKLKRFLHDLLMNPADVSVPDIFTMSGYNRSKLVKTLMNNGVIERDERIVDKDENGEPKIASMKVRYRVPKKDFERKMKKLFIKMFERNIPDKSISEDAGGCCADAGVTSASSSGQYVQPVFGVQRKTIANAGVTETTAMTNVGDIAYDAPAFLDAATADRKGGKEHSVCVNH